MVDNRAAAEVAMRGSTKQMRPMKSLEEKSFKYTEEIMHDSMLPLSNYTKLLFKFSMNTALTARAVGPLFQVSVLCARGIRAMD